MNKDDDDDFYHSNFEIELAQMETVAEIQTMWNLAKVTARPDPPEVNYETDSLTFQQIDIGNYIGDAMTGMSGPQSGSVPIIRMFGVTMDGNSICCHCHGFVPYFYIGAPKGFDHAHCQSFKEALNKAIITDMRSNKEQLNEAVLKVSLVQDKSRYGYHGEDDFEFIKITLALPQLIATAKRLLEKTIVHSRYDFQNCRSYESDIDFDLRFMVDTGVVGCSWIELPAGTYRPRSRFSMPSIESRCQIEVDVVFDKFIAHEPEGEWAKVAPFRILSFDIECAGRKGIFPEAQHDPVIQIANMVIRQGDTVPFMRNVFTLNTCAPIIGSQVITNVTETDLLDRWSNFIREVDPDILTGYNINNFDLPYLLNRAHHLKVKDFEYLSRIKNIRSVIQSKQTGRHKNKHVNFEGRVPFDLFPVLLQDYKLPSYTLNAVAQHFLQEKKEDVHHSIITELQNGNVHTRRRLAIYCIKDAYLPWCILNKLMCIVDYMKMARLTGVSLASLLTRGQHIKMVGQQLREGNAKGCLRTPIKPEKIKTTASKPIPEPEIE